MDDDDRVRARFDDLVQIADGAEPRGPRERAVEPDGVAAANEIAAGEIARRQIVVTGDGDERPSETPGHVLDEPGLAAAGRALEHERQPARVAHLEDGDLVGRGEIERRVGSRVAETVVPAAVRRRSPNAAAAAVVVVAHAGVGAACAGASLCTRCRGARKKKSQRNSATPAANSVPVATSIRKCT